MALRPWCSGPLHHPNHEYQKSLLFCCYHLIDGWFLCHQVAHRPQRKKMVLSVIISVISLEITISVIVASSVFKYWSLWKTFFSSHIFSLSKLFFYKSNKKCIKTFFKTVDNFSWHIRIESLSRKKCTFLFVNLSTSGCWKRLYTIFDFMWIILDVCILLGFKRCG